MATKKESYSSDWDFDGRGTDLSGSGASTVAEADRLYTDGQTIISNAYKIDENQATLGSRLAKAEAERLKSLDTIDGYNANNEVMKAREAYARNGNDLMIDDGLEPDLATNTGQQNQPMVDEGGNIIPPEQQTQYDKERQQQYGTQGAAQNGAQPMLRQQVTRRPLTQAEIDKRILDTAVLSPRARMALQAKVQNDSISEAKSLHYSAPDLAIEVLRKNGIKNVPPLRMNQSTGSYEQTMPDGRIVRYDKNMAAAYVSDIIMGTDEAHKYQLAREAEIRKQAIDNAKSERDHKENLIEKASEKQFQIQLEMMRQAGQDRRSRVLHGSGGSGSANNLDPSEAIVTKSQGTKKLDFSKATTEELKAGIEQNIKAQESSKDNATKQKIASYSEMIQSELSRRQNNTTQQPIKSQDVQKSQDVTQSEEPSKYYELKNISDKAQESLDNAQRELNRATSLKYRRTVTPEHIEKIKKDIDDRKLVYEKSKSNFDDWYRSQSTASKPPKYVYQPKAY
jgi:hypothetical protein